MTPPGDIDVDLAIVGAGPIGASLACALRGCDLRLALIDAAPAAVAKPGFDDRSLALAYGSVRILTALGLWREVPPQAVPIHTVHVSERGLPGAVRIRHTDYAVDALGYVVIARRIGALLDQGLEAAGDPLLRLAPATVTGVEFAAERARLTLADGRRVSATLLVGADGAESPLRTLASVPTRRRCYGQTAVVANVQPRQDHRNTAFERFTPAGPIALLPLPDRRCSLIASVTDHLAQRLLVLPEDEFLVWLDGIFGGRLGGFSKLGRRAVYPLEQVIADAAAPPRLVLIGNAAHTLHPVAGQGFNLGLRDAAVLAELLVEAHHSGRDLGGAALAERYRAWRRADRRLMVSVTDLLPRLFSNRLAPLRAARGLGLAGLELLPGATTLLARHAMGIAGRLPRLTRGLPLAVERSRTGLAVSDKPH